MLPSKKSSKISLGHLCSLKCYICAFTLLVILVFSVCIKLDIGLRFITSASIKVPQLEFRRRLYSFRDEPPLNINIVFPTSSLFNSSPRKDDIRLTTLVAPLGSPYDVFGNRLNESRSDRNRQSTCNSCMSHNFRYVINSETLCKQYEENQGIKLLVLVLTIHKNRAARDAIRDTWLSVARGNVGNVRYAFLLGETTNSTLQKAILEESKQFGDILKEDYVDTYQNLTYKTMMAMKWAATRCSAAQFLLKADDDMFVNMPALLDLINVKKNILQEAVMGSCNQKARPNRNINSKWYASIRSYPSATYPGFCSGTAYVTSLTVVRKVYEVSPNVPFFHLEDVYVALCIKKLGFGLVKVRGFNVGRPKLDPCLYKSPALLTSHRLEPQILRSIWHQECVNNRAKTRIILKT